MTRQKPGTYPKTNKHADRVEELLREGPKTREGLALRMHLSTARIIDILDVVKQRGHLKCDTSRRPFVYEVKP